MNPRDYTTWTSFADHPIFTERERPPREWSSNPKLYDDFRCDAFDPEWYIHTDPKLPTATQAAIAARDIQNLIATCDLIHKQFGAIDHELFILDDLTVFVRIISRRFTLDLYPSDYGDNREVMTVLVEEPFETEFVVDSIYEIVSRLVELVNQD